VLLFLLSCYLMFLARNAAAHRRPLGLRSDPATTLGLGAYLLRHTYLLNMTNTSKDQDERTDHSPRQISIVGDETTKYTGIIVRLKGLTGTLVLSICAQFCLTPIDRYSREAQDQTQDLETTRHPIRVAAWLTGHFRYHRSRAARSAKFCLQADAFPIRLRVSSRLARVQSQILAPLSARNSSCSRSFHVVGRNRQSFAHSPTFSVHVQGHDRCQTWSSLVLPVFVLVPGKCSGCFQ
jgi:hypothetical protein